MKNKNTRKAVRARQQLKQKAKPKVGKKRKATSTVMAGQPKILRDYMHCRLDPFNSGSGVGIPDQSAGKRIVVDHRCYFDIQVGSTGGFALRLVPSPSNPVWIKDVSSSVTTSGVITGAINANVIPSVAYSTLGSWVAMQNPEFPLLVIGNITGAPAANPYGATKLRVVSQAMKLRYTGTTVNQAGTITTYPSAMAFDYPPQPNTAVVTMPILGGAPTNFAIGTLECVTADASEGVNLVSGVVCTNVSEGHAVINQKNTPDNLWVSYNARPFAFLESDASTCTLTGLNGNSYGVVQCLDPNWSSSLTLVQGMVAGTTVRIESVICVEYLLEPKSVMARIATERPSVAPAILQKTEAVISKAPVAGTLGLPERLFNMALKGGSLAAAAYAGPSAGMAVNELGALIKGLVF